MKRCQSSLLTLSKGFRSFCFMPRKLRVEYEGAIYHVMNRGHRGGTLYRTDTDRRRFLGLVGELPERFGLEIHAFVLMDNHYHLLIETPKPNLSLGMRQLNGRYTQAYQTVLDSAKLDPTLREDSLVVAAEAKLREGNTDLPRKALKMAAKEQQRQALKEQRQR